MEQMMLPVTYINDEIIRTDGVIRINRNINTHYVRNVLFWFQKVEELDSSITRYNENPHAGS